MSMGIFVNGQRFKVETLGQEGTVHTVSVDGKPITIRVLKEIGNDPLDLLLGVENKILRLVVENANEDLVPIRLNGRQLTARLEIVERLDSASKKGQDEGPIIITAPMSGRIASLMVSAGTPAEEGQSLVILEAMKMENEIVSPKKGMIKEVYVQTGTLVKAGDKIALVD